MALGHAAEGILVNCLCPGSVDTPLLGLFASPDEMEEIRRSLPLDRIGVREEVASAALNLVSDEASFVTGSAWTVDGVSQRSKPTGYSSVVTGSITASTPPR